MRNNTKTREECIAVIGSITQAMHAQKVLVGSLIRTELIKVDSSVTGRGCAYALLYPCSMDQALQRTLQDASIRFRKGRR